MFRKSFIIKKDNLFKWIESEQLSRVEIANSYNKTLRDKTLCKIYVYFKIPIMDLNTIFGACKSELEKIKIGIDHAFVNGIQNLKGQGFISEKHLKKLIEIEERNGVNFSISKTIRMMPMRRVKE